MDDTLLAIGTIVKLKNIDAVDMMILGYYPIDKDMNEMYEYLAVIYPQGILNENSFFLLNSTDIAEVVYQGYADEESKLLREMIPKALKAVADKEEA